jgi:hypothetical protein
MARAFIAFTVGNGNFRRGKEQIIGRATIVSADLFLFECS